MRGSRGGHLESFELTYLSATKASKHELFTITLLSTVQVVNSIIIIIITIGIFFGTKAIGVFTGTTGVLAGDDAILAGEKIIISESSSLSLSFSNAAEISA